MKTQKGFTLIELMVVVIIIGVLAAIAIPRFIGAQHRARVNAAVADVSIIRQGLGLYHIDNGDYPATAADWAAFKTSLVDPNGDPYVTLPKEGGTITVFTTTNKYTRVDANNYKLAAAIVGIPAGYVKKYVLATADSIYADSTESF